MAKRKLGNGSRKARTPKLISVEGHEMTEAMYAAYEKCIESRARTNKDGDAGRILYLGLEDFLAGYRPSHKIKRQLSDLSHRTTDLGIAFGAMGDYAFYSDDVAIRSAAVELLKKLALEIYYVSAKLTAFAMGVEGEKQSKLQDWQAHAASVEAIGTRKVISNG